MAEAGGGQAGEREGARYDADEEVVFVDEVTCLVGPAFAGRRGVGGRECGVFVPSLEGVGRDAVVGTEAVSPHDELDEREWERVAWGDPRAWSFEAGLPDRRTVVQRVQNRVGP